MANQKPPSLTPAQRSRRHDRAARVARELGFTGHLEYHHVYSQTGGAQYGQGRSAEEDLLLVYAEAFERDADPEDFSLRAILAHERGHQLLARHPRLVKRVEGITIPAEEILASLLGAILCSAESERASLVAKATIELISHGEAAEAAVRRLQELSDLLESLL